MATKNSLSKPMKTACLSKDKTNKGWFLFVCLLVDWFKSTAMVTHDKAWQDA